MISVIGASIAIGFMVSGQLVQAESQPEQSLLDQSKQQNEENKQQPEKSQEEVRAVGADNIAVRLQTAKDFYDKRDQAGMNDQAIEEYRALLAEQPMHYEAGWQLARALYWKANQEKNRTQALTYLAEGEKITKQLTEKYPDKKNGLFWYGVSLGRAAELRGVLNSLFAVGPMHDTMKKILATKPQDPDAHHFLGVLYRKAPGWPLSLGDSKKSLHHAELAVQYNPDDVLNVLDYGRTLLAHGKREEAKTQFERVLTMPGLPDRQPETKDYKKEAEQELAKIK